MRLIPPPRARGYLPRGIPPAGYLCLRASDTSSARLILSIYPPCPPPPSRTLPQLRASDTSARLIPPLRDTSARLIPPPRDTSVRLILPPRDTSPAGYLCLRASDTSSARLILSIYPPARPPPPRVRSLRSARLIPPRV